MAAIPSTVPMGQLTLENYKSMLGTFRVQELQSLLSSCGRCRTGRKNDLLSRAVSLVKLNNESSLARKAKSRIIDLYKQRYPEGAPDILLQNLPTTSHPPPYNEHDKLFSPKNNIKTPPTSSMKLNQSPRYVGITKNTSAVPVHPDVRFKRLPFQELLDTLVRPSSMVQKSVNSYQQMQLTVHLSPHQVQLISHARSYSIQGKVEYSVQVILRFCLAETSCIQEDLYPSKCGITVNGRHCPLPGSVQTSSNQSEPKKPHRAVNITHLCRLSPMSSEQIRINWLPSDSGQRYATTVELVKMISPSVLIQKLKSKAERNADHSRALIKEKLAHDPDSEIATTSLKVSLSCPIGRMKMEYPCRATTCSHVQCFDASLYIQMNERKPSWICPVCDQRAFYENLLIDGLFKEIIRSAPSAEEIIFSQDGSWKPLSDSDEDTELKPTHSLIDKTIVLPSTPDSSDIARQKETQAEKRTDVEIIDLISDDDDDNGDINTGRYSSSMLSQGPSSHYGTTHPDPRAQLLPHPPPLVHAGLHEMNAGISEPLSHSIHQSPRGRGPRFRHVPPSIGQDPSLMHMPPGYGAQSLHDLYSILPPSERLTAAMYLNEAGLLMDEDGPSVSDIISLD